MSKQARIWLKRQIIPDDVTSKIMKVLVSVDEEGICRITQQSIAEKSGFTERTVRRHLDLLEAHGAIRRERQNQWGRKGRSADVLVLTLNRDFDFTKSGAVSGKSEDGLTGHGVRMINADQPDFVSGAPTASRAHYYIKKDIYVSDSVNYHCTGRVTFDKNRQMWRAKITLDGIDFDLGRHEAPDLAEAEILVTFQEIEHAATHKAGTPFRPATIDPSLKKLTGEDLYRFLIGESGARSSAPRLLQKTSHQVNQ